MTATREPTPARASPTRRSRGLPSPSLADLSGTSLRGRKLHSLVVGNRRDLPSVFDDGRDTAHGYCACLRFIPVTPDRRDPL